MERIYMVVKDITTEAGCRAFNVVGVFDAMGRARGCLLRMRDNVVRRFGKDCTEDFSDREIRLRKDGCRCSLRICEETVGKDLSYLDKVL